MENSVVSSRYIIFCRAVMEELICEGVFRRICVRTPPVAVYGASTSFRIRCTCAVTLRRVFSQFTPSWTTRSHEPAQPYRQTHLPAGEDNVSSVCVGGGGNAMAESMDRIRGLTARTMAARQIIAPWRGDGTVCHRAMPALCSPSLSFTFQDPRAEQ